ncbi:hypothetical protein FHX42_000798 [Saccharopolyspora lacisalsi]|uniref:DUF8017 domain-containing protein n=1 Tax=Halosaccharopolyspora lacisalsi TaxID=1000566 RepID=A0A839DRV8_9PSEU|nr:hypothetical protein [Halosaccharopolyspora lacisalsi]MBA8823469.1 hypothetical protein [Halosaccharopolyspora lacisalsi]
MTTPGGSGNWGPNQYGSGQYYDPITGQPSGPAASGQSGYQGFGVFEQQQGWQGAQAGPPPGPPPGPPRKSRAALISTLAITVVGIVVITATVMIVGGDDTKNQASTTASATTTTTSTTTTSPSPSSTASSHNTPAVVPGWQGVALPEAGIAYDIPPGWETRLDRFSGYKNKNGDSVSMTNFSSYKRDFCPSADLSYRARVGVTTTEEKDPVRAAEKTLQKWAMLGWSTEDGTPPGIAKNPITPVSVEGNSNGQPQLLSATITPAAPGPCGTESVFISILALPSNAEAALLIGIADQGVPEAVPPQTINRSLTSLRWLPE